MPPEEAQGLGGAAKGNTPEWWPAWTSKGASKFIQGGEGRQGWWEGMAPGARRRADQDKEGEGLVAAGHTET